MGEEFNKELDIVPDEEGWEPEGYVQPDEDEVFVEREHAHPLEVEQNSKEGDSDG